MREHIRQHFGQYLLCIGLFAASLAAFGISTLIDFDYWTSVAKSDLSKIEYGGGSIVFRSVTFLFAAVVAVQWRKSTLGGWAKGGFAAVILLSFASIGMSSILGFGARERIVPYEQSKAEAAAKIGAFDKAETRRIALEDAEIARKHQKEDDQISFLRSQAEKVRGPQSRQVTYDAMAPLTGFATEVIPAPTVILPPKIEMASDPQAEALHGLFPSWSIENIQIATTAIFGVGLIVAEMVSMGFAVGMWPKYQPPAAQTVTRGYTVEDDVVVLEPKLPELQGADIIHPPQFARTEQAAIVGEPVEDDEPNQGDLLRDVDEHMTAGEQVAEFWAARTRMASGATITATAMYDAFVAWAREAYPNGTPMKQKMFGNYSGHICDRQKIAGLNNYINRAIVVEGDRLLMAA